MDVADYFRLRDAAVARLQFDKTDLAGGTKEHQLRKGRRKTYAANACNRAERHRFSSRAA